MKKIVSILFIIILYINGFGQSVVPRSNSSITVQDSRWQAQYNMFVPRYADTTAANLQKGIDTLGAIIYTYDVQSFWGRQYSSGKKWVALGSGGGGGSGTVTNIATGLGLSGGPITTTGTILVDTASASILSRQRAAATYALIGDVTDPFLPTTGTGTATGNITGDLGANTLTIQGSVVPLLTIDPVQFITTLNANDGTAGAGLELDGDLTGTNVRFALTSSDGVNTVRIVGNPITNTLTYTADTHTFNIPSVDGAFRVIDGSSFTWVDISNGASSQNVTISSKDPTNDFNVSRFSAATDPTTATFEISSSFNDGVKEANILGATDATTSTIAYTADSHNFTGNVLPTTDNTYTLGDATHRWSEINVMGSSIKMYGSSSGVVTIGTPAAAGTFNFNLPITAGTSGQVLTSAGGGASAMTWTTPTTGTVTSVATGLGLSGGTITSSGTLLVDTASASILSRQRAAATYAPISITGTVTSVAQSFTGGLISVGGSPITTSGTLALTVAGTSGGIPYFSSSSAWASSAALAANALVIGGGAGVAPSTTTTASGILTFLGTPSSANLASAVTNETGSGLLVFGTAPSMSSITLAAGTASAGTAPLYLTSGTNLTAAVGGAVEYDGNSLFSSTASGRGVSPSVMFAAIQSDFTMSDVNTVQPVFPTTSDVWTLQASTTYFFEGSYTLTHGATSHSTGMSFELGGGASVTAIEYQTVAWATAIGTNTASQTTNNINVTTNTAINAAGSIAVESIIFSGIIRVNAKGTFTPSITWSSAPGGTPKAVVGTWIRFTPIGSNTVASVGNVN